MRMVSSPVLVIDQTPNITIPLSIPHPCCASSHSTNRHRCNQEHDPPRNCCCQNCIRAGQRRRCWCFDAIAIGANPNLQWFAGFNRLIPGDQVGVIQAVRPPPDHNVGGSPFGDDPRCAVTDRRDDDCVSGLRFFEIPA